MTWIAVLFLRPLAAIAIAWLLLRVLRVQHPASQHAVWTAAMIGMLVIIPLSLTVPQWSVPLLPATPAPILHSSQPAVPPASAPPSSFVPAVRTALPAPPATSHRMPLSIPWLAIAYLSGVIAVGGRDLTGRILSAQLIRGATPVRGRLRESSDVVVPVTAGFRSPVVILPSSWRDWPAAKRRVVLRHEFAHIRRGDLRTSALAGCVRSLLWFHPAAWWAARKTAALAEMACDAAVVETDGSPGAYCRVLLEFTEQVSDAGFRSTLPGLAMVGADRLGRRIEQVFAASRGDLRRLARPRLALLLGMAPAFCIAAALHPGAYTRIDWRTAPFRVLLFLQGQHVGKLSPELVPCERMQAEELLPASDAERASIPPPLAAGDRVLIRTTFFTKDKRLKLALVEPEQGDPYLYADVNFDGSFEPSERFSFTPTTSRLLPKYSEVILRVPYTTGPYSIYPIRIMLPENRIYREMARKGGLMLLRSPFAFVTGSVEIGGASIAARYQFDIDKGAAYPDFGWLGMDCNGDGWIDERANQDEFTYAKDESILFHVNGHDIATVSLDLKGGTFVVREHPAADNQRISLHLGDAVPDFAFTDLDGKPRHFSEFRGKFVLLDFWGTWCGPCRRQLPNLEKAYRQFGSRGLVVLGMDDDREADKAREVLSAAEVTYPQSTGDAGYDLVHKRFRIDRFPTLVLLNPEGKVIALDANEAFSADHIADTLNRWMPVRQ